MPLISNKFEIGSIVGLATSYGIFPYIVCSFNKKANPQFYYLGVKPNLSDFTLFIDRVHKRSFVMHDYRTIVLTEQNFTPDSWVEIQKIRNYLIENNLIKINKDDSGE